MYLQEAKQLIEFFGLGKPKTSEEQLNKISSSIESLKKQCRSDIELGTRNKSHDSRMKESMVIRCVQIKGSKLVTQLKELKKDSNVNKSKINNLLRELE